jgi:putative ABC transport system substrate-binding protein
MRARPIVSIITLAFDVLTTSPLAEAQPAGRSYRIGVLLAAPATAVTPQLDALRERLRDLGYREGQNLALDVRWVSTTESALDRLATDLVRSKVDLLVAWTTPATLAAKRATSTIPIVMVSIGDPVGSGLVASLSRPGGNVTGVSNVARDLTGKLLQLLTEVLPDARRIAALRNPTNPAAATAWPEIQAAAKSFGIQPLLVEAREPRDLEPAFAAMARNRAAGIVIVPDALFLKERRRIADLAEQTRLATIFQRSENVEAGGLMSYGPKLTEQFRQVANYIDRILKGAKPATLPVEQPTQFELVINLRSAKALGLAIPPSLLARADHVIQ